MGIKIKNNKTNTMASIDEIVKKEVMNQIVDKFDKAKGQMESNLIEKIIKELEVVKPFEINLPDGKKKKVSGLRHEELDNVLNFMATRTPLLLVGPAGSGKTQAAIQSAELLGLKHHAISVNEQTSKTDFLGFKDAKGEIVKTNFRECFEEGGVFIIDEIDAGNPNILTVVNSALSNNFCSFPDGLIERHEDFICVCTANTFGEGESLQYIGRNVLDAATKDRFATIFMDYSKIIERVLLPRTFDLINELRDYFKGINYNFVVSTRGGLRLETMFAAKKGILKKKDVVDCLNLHLEIKKDAKVTQIVGKYAE